ncbi:MAG: nucleoside-diphosphate-sugar epimerase [Phycisphaerales bacterium]|nr:nucleoside-diphosphate-sugar epimerase [Phycisphaerales bacterium]
MTSTVTQSDRIAVTGAGGFLGSFVLEQLAARGYIDVVSVRQKDYDLTHEVDADRMYADIKPDVVVHLAAEVGGIGANRENPGRYFFANMAMGLHLIEGARKHGLKKFVQTGTICAYPNLTPVPFKESDLWNGYPEVTNAPYGIAKKSLLVMCQSYRQQYGLNAIYLLPVNLYGPRDNFDLKTSHIIPAIVRKCVEAKERGDAEIVAWGSGNVSREFLYVEDCARGLVDAMEKYDSPEPMNLGNGREVTIRQAIETIAKLVGFEGKITWDASKPDGQPRRCLDVSRARETIGFVANTPFEEGLRKTIQWFTTHKNQARL